MTVSNDVTAKISISGLDDLVVTAKVIKTVDTAGEYKESRSRENPLPFPHVNGNNTSKVSSYCG